MLPTTDAIEIDEKEAIIYPVAKCLRNNIFESLSPFVIAFLRALLRISVAVQNSKAAHSLYDAAFRAQILKGLIESLRSSDRSCSSSCVSEAVQVASDLVLTSSKFITQFIECEGLRALDELGVFQQDQHSANDTGDVLVTSLQICSHLIRNTEQYYDQLTAVLNPLKLHSILALV